MGSRETMGASPSLLQDKIAEYERDREKRIKAYDKERQARLDLFSKDRDERLSRFEEQRGQRMEEYEKQKQEVGTMHERLRLFEQQLLKKWADMANISVSELQAAIDNKEKASKAEEELRQKVEQQAAEIADLKEKLKKAAANQPEELMKENERLQAEVEVAQQFADQAVEEVGTLTAQLEVEKGKVEALRAQLQAQ